MTGGATRFTRAIAAIDAANAADPNEATVGGDRGPKERLHAERVTHWIETLEPDASELLRLAGRAHHLRRWEIPRHRFPQGRSGYLRWRKELQKFHAARCAEILQTAGYDAEAIGRVEAILRKRGLGRDPEVQTFEDALCLTFFETQLGDFSEQQPKAREVLAKTLRKMSREARRLAWELPLAPATRAALDRAVAQIESEPAPTDD